MQNWERRHESRQRSCPLEKVHFEWLDRTILVKVDSGAGAFIIEDDYDSEYRFEGRPIPALMSLDPGSSVIVVGSFSKLLFPSLHIGYIVAPPARADLVVAFRVQTDFRAVHFEQALSSLSLSVAATWAGTCVRCERSTRARMLA